MLKTREIFVVRLIQFVFLLQEYLYIGKMVHLVVPTPSNHFLRSLYTFILYYIYIYLISNLWWLLQGPKRIPNISLIIKALLHTEVTFNNNIGTFYSLAFTFNLVDAFVVNESPTLNYFPNNGPLKSLVAVLGSSFSHLHLAKCFKQLTISFPFGFQGHNQRMVLKLLY